MFPAVTRSSKRVRKGHLVFDGGRGDVQCSKKLLNFDTACGPQATSERVRYIHTGAYLSANHLFTGSTLHLR